MTRDEYYARMEELENLYKRCEGDYHKAFDCSTDSTQKAIECFEVGDYERCDKYCNIARQEMEIAEKLQNMQREIQMEEANLIAEYSVIVLMA